MTRAGKFRAESGRDGGANDGRDLRGVQTLAGPGAFFTHAGTMRRCDGDRRHRRSTLSVDFFSSGELQPVDRLVPPSRGSPARSPPAYRGVYGRYRGKSRRGIKRLRGHCKRRSSLPVRPYGGRYIIRPHRGRGTRRRKGGRAGDRSGNVRRRKTFSRLDALLIVRRRGLCLAGKK